MPHTSPDYRLRSGAATIDITPPLGTQLCGVVDRRRPAQTVYDPLFVRTVIFEISGQRLCLIALDLVLVTRRYCDAIIEAVCEQFDFEPASVMVHGTQTHSAPSLGPSLFDDDLNLDPSWDWLRFYDSAYSNFVVEKAIESVALASGKLQPVRLGVLSGIDGRFAFNRRGVTRSGQIAMPPAQWQEPLGPTHIRYLEGPIDPELGVIATQTESGELNTLMVNYTCHPVHLFSKPECIVSADWPGVVCNELKDVLGAQCTPLVVNGACGNINPWDPYNPDYREDHLHMGRSLSGSVQAILGEMQFQESTVLDGRTRTIKLPFRAQEPAQFEQDEKLLEANPEPVWANEDQSSLNLDWVFAALRRSVYLQQQREGQFDYEIKVFRIGDAAIVGLPGEPFAEGGLEIKMASPASFTYIAHNVSQYAGYIPVKNSFKHGGHEANLTWWSKLAPEAWEIIAAVSLELLHELFSDRKN